MRRVKATRSRWHKGGRVQRWEGAKAKGGSVQWQEGTSSRGHKGAKVGGHKGQMQKDRYI